MAPSRPCPAAASARVSRSNSDLTSIARPVMSSSSATHRVSPRTWTATPPALAMWIPDVGLDRHVVPLLRPLHQQAGPAVLHDPHRSPDCGHRRGPRRPPTRAATLCPPSTGSTQSHLRLAAPAQPVQVLCRIASARPSPRQLQADVEDRLSAKIGDQSSPAVTSPPQSISSRSLRRKASIHPSPFAWCSTSPTRLVPRSPHAASTPRLRPSGPGTASGCPGARTVPRSSAVQRRRTSVSSLSAHPPVARSVAWIARLRVPVAE